MNSLAARVPVARAALAALTAVALATLPQRAAAAPSPTSEPPGAASPEGEGGSVAPPAPEDAEDRGGPPDTEAPAPEIDPVADPATDPDVDAEPATDPDAEPDTGPAGDPDDAAVVDTDTSDDRDPATEPAAPEPVEPEPEAAELETQGDELPELSTLQKAGWWTLFGAFAVGTTAGVFAGLAERQEDRALRLATLFDSDTGMQPIYEDYRADYERHLRRGRAFERTAIGLGAVTGAVLIAGIVLFALDASRRRVGDRDARRARLRPGVGGWEVQF